jgi:hypothetical protein
MNTPEPANPLASRVKSHIPGRVRFLLHAGQRSPAAMDAIQEQLQGLQGIDEVRLNPANGSVTIRYDHARHTMAGLLGLLEDLDVVVESIGHLPSVGEAGHGNGGSQPEFLAAIEDLNQRLREATRLPVNLKLLLPLSFIGAGLWSIGRRGLMIESVPGWLFLWFAFDMFVKLHPARPRQES